MKIGIDIRSAIGSKAGIGAYTEYLVKGLPSVDKKNNYLIYTSEEVDWDLGDNFTQIVWPCNTVLQKILWQIRLWIEVILFGKVDVFLSTNSVILALLSWPRRNVVLTIHDLVPFLMRHTTELKVRFWFTFLPIAAKLARAIIVPSEATKKDVVKFLGVKEDQIYLTWEGPTIPEAKVVKDDIKRVKEKYGIKDDYFLFISTLEPRKNIPNLIKGFAKFSSESKLNVLLVIGGKKGWLYNDIFEVAKSEGVEDKVIFTDYVPDEDMLALHKGALAYTNIPLMEGFGLSQLVAMKWGVPVLSSNTSSIPEVVGDAGILVDPDEIDEIAMAMKKLAESGKLREELIKKGRKQAENFSWEKTAKLTLEVLEGETKK